MTDPDWKTPDATWRTSYTHVLKLSPEQATEYVNDALTALHRITVDTEGPVMPRVEAAKELIRLATPSLPAAKEKKDA